MSAVLELLLADARTPSGGHAHSGGLEAALAAGLAVAEVPGFMRARLRTVGLVDAAFAALATRAGTLEELLALDFELAAHAGRAPAPRRPDARRRPAAHRVRVVAAGRAPGRLRRRERADPAPRRPRRRRPRRRALAPGGGAPQPLRRRRHRGLGRGQAGGARRRGRERVGGRARGRDRRARAQRPRRRPAEHVRAAAGPPRPRPRPRRTEALCQLIHPPARCASGSADRWAPARAR